MHGNTRAMMRLMLELRTRSEAIKRAAYLTKLTFGPVTSQSFTVVATWKEGQLSKQYDYGSYFRTSPSGGSVMTRPPCRIKQDLIREILTKRGI